MSVARPHSRGPPCLAPAPRPICPVLSASHLNTTCYQFCRHLTGTCQPHLMPARREGRAGTFVGGLAGFGGRLGVSRAVVVGPGGLVGGVCGDLGFDVR